MANNSNGLTAMKTTLGTMEEVKKIFDKFDANGDGKITKPELKSLIESLGSVTTPSELDQMIGTMDVDGDGSIDLAEFSAAFQGPSATATTEVRDAFEVYDLDGDGRITARELHEVMRRLGEKCSVEECEKMIKSVDLDGDGCVDFHEFLRMMKQ